eukprot:418244_1
MATRTRRRDTPMFIATANALAGAAGGVIAMSIVFPLDIIRTQLQAKATETSSTIKITSASLLSSPDPNIEEEDMDEKKEIPEFTIHKHIGIKEVVNKIYDKEGLSGFYRALPSQLICIFVSDIVYFFAVTLIKQVFYGKREVEAMSNLKSSIVAGIINVFATAPFWRAQVQLMLQSKKLKTLDEDNGYITKGNMDECEESKEEEEETMHGLMDAWRKIYERDGFSGLYKGIGPSLYLVSNPIIQFVVYEELVNILKRYQKTEQLSALTYFVCGAVGKTAATFATYPLQVMQTQLRKKDTPFKDMMDCLNRFAIPKIKNGELGPLFSGLSAKLYQTVSNSAIKFMIYEKVLVFIKFLLRWIKKTCVAMLFMMFVSETNGGATVTAHAQQ